MKKGLRHFLHNFFKIFIVFMIGIAVVNLVLLVVLITNHNNKLEKEAAHLSMPGKLVTVNGHELHALVGGDDEASQTLVFLHNSKVVDDSVTLEPLFDKLEGCRYVYIERSGYGYSEVSGTTMNSETIVEEYRLALKELGIEGPYILVTSGTSGVYAFGWARTYPDEISDIIGLDMNYPEQFSNITPDEYSGFFDYLLVKFCDIGGHRLLKGIFPADSYGVYTEDQMKERHALFGKGAYNQDIYSEVSLTVESAKRVIEKGFPENVDMLLIYGNPMMEPYINEDAEVRSTYEEAVAKNPDVDYVTEYNKGIREYFGKYENVQVLEVSGPSKYYTYKPEELAKIINEYID